MWHKDGEVKPTTGQVWSARRREWVRPEEHASERAEGVVTQGVVGLVLVVCAACALALGWGAHSLGMDHRGPAIGGAVIGGAASTFAVVRYPQAVRAFTTHLMLLLGLALLAGLVVLGILSSR